MNTSTGTKTGSDRAPGEGTTAPGPPQGRKEAKPRRRRLKISPSTLAAQFGIVAVLLTLWEVLPGNPEDGALVDEFFVSRPSGVVDAFGRWAESGDLLGDISTTLQATIIGFVVGSIVGAAVGLLLGISPKTAAIFRPFVVAGYSVPKLAFAPLFVLWFGLGLESKIVLVAVGTFFLTFFNAYAGARDVNQNLLNMVRIMNGSRLEVHRKVTIPSAFIWMFNGFRMSLPYAFLFAIVGEFVVSNQGIGHRISRSAAQFDPAMLFAGIFVTIVLSVTLTALIGAVEKRVLRWKSAGNSVASL